jgi:AraC-like DNA-binding protein
MYQETAARLPGAVRWSRTVLDGPATARILPDGCLDLIWVRPAGPADLGWLMVAGPDTRAQLSHSAAGTRYLGLRFAPGTGAAILGVPADELRDRRPDLADIWPEAEVRRLTERLAGSADPVGLIESVAVERLRSSGPPDPSLPAVVTALRTGVGVADLADRIGYSERQLHRRCLTWFGYGPKTLSRVLRFERAVSLARRGVGFATVAASTGYADQAHLSREVRALAGVPLGTLITK